MTDLERRKHRRLPLHLAVRGAGWKRPRRLGGWVTSNVSSGGMSIRVPVGQAPRSDSLLDFTLLVPSGEGHSCRDSAIRGSGRVTRLEDLGGGWTALGVQFTTPLAVETLKLV